MSVIQLLLRVYIFNIFIYLFIYACILRLLTRHGFWLFGVVQPVTVSNRLFYLSTTVLTLLKEHRGCIKSTLEQEYFAVQKYGLEFEMYLQNLKTHLENQLNVKKMLQSRTWTQGPLNVPFV